jgi:predicted RNase H-like nuclease
VDGCKKGWVVAEWNTSRKGIRLAVFASFAEVLAAYSDERARAIAVDIPIGLVDGSRRCDTESRAVLTCRKSSVFPAPYRCYANAIDYHTTNAESKERFGRGISAQAFGIYRKVAEVNGQMTPELQARVIEVHPEICFWAMNGQQDVCASKHSGPGYLQRLALLKASIELPDIEWDNVESGVRGAQPDDVLDAVAAAWTARKWVNGSFGRFPAVEELDAKGLRAEIIY